MPLLTVSLTSDDGRVTSVSSDISDEQASRLSDAIGVMLFDKKCVGDAVRDMVDAASDVAETARPTVGKIVNDHMGGTYASGLPESVICEPCPLCGDSDWVDGTWAIGDAESFTDAYMGYLLGELDFDADEVHALVELLYVDADELDEALDALADPPALDGLGSVDPAAQEALSDGSFSKAALGHVDEWLARNGIRPEDGARRAEALYDAIERPKTRADVRHCPLCHAMSDEESSEWKPTLDEFCGVLGPTMLSIWEKLPE